MSITDVLDALREELVVTNTVPPLQPAGWSDRPKRETLEPVPDHPCLWQEPAASAALCCWCPEPLAEGDPIACVIHRERLSVTACTPKPSIAVTLGPAISRDDMLALAELRGWEALTFKPGESAGGSEQMWRTFAGWAR